ncbi:MAG: M67 family metallopeptidase [Chloroflexi bacterium]|nr:M67 family metallopeptidase [Chloroflexota bacterium]
MIAKLIWFTPGLYGQMIRHAQSAAPDEACGVLLGNLIPNGIAQVAQVIQVENIAPDPRVTYHLDDRRLAQIMGSLERTGQDVVGFFHSHPQSDPIPSQSDVRQAYYPDIPYLIVGLGGARPAAAAWRMRDGAVSRVDIQVSDDLPPPPRSEISPLQKWTVLVTALLSLLLVIAWGLTLLPPAPEIPR